MRSSVYGIGILSSVLCCEAIWTTVTGNGPIDGIEDGGRHLQQASNEIICGEGEEEAILDILLDSKPKETGWKLVCEDDASDDPQQVIVWDKPEGSFTNDRKGTWVTETACIAKTATCAITIHDMAGDGLNGDGWYAFRYGATTIALYNYPDEPFTADTFCFGPDCEQPPLEIDGQSEPESSEIEPANQEEEAKQDQSQQQQEKQQPSQPSGKNKSQGSSSSDGTSQTETDSGSSAVAIGAIVGISIAAAVAFAVIVCAIVYCCRRNRQRSSTYMRFERRVMGGRSAAGLPIMARETTNARNFAAGEKNEKDPLDKHEFEHNDAVEETEDEFSNSNSHTGVEKPRSWNNGKPSSWKDIHL